MDVAIRLATRDDVAALERLVEESVRRLSVGYYSPEEIERSLRLVFGVDTQLIDDGTYYVAEVGGELAGCGGWSRRATLFGGDQAKGAEDPLLDPARDPARIRACFVGPGWARRGVGTRLLIAAEEAAWRAGFGDATLVATLPGVPLYAARGYVTEAELEIDLEDGYRLKAARMRKTLGGRSDGGRPGGGGA